MPESKKSVEDFAAELTRCIMRCAPRLHKMRTGDCERFENHTATWAAGPNEGELLLSEEAIERHLETCLPCQLLAFDAIASLEEEALYWADGAGEKGEKESRVHSSEFPIGPFYNDNVLWGFIVEKYPDMSVLTNNLSVVGVFRTAKEAVREGKRRYGKDNFSVLIPQILGVLCG